MLHKDFVKSWFIRCVWRWCWECDRHPFLLFRMTQKNMEHLGIVKQKLSDKKNFRFNKESFADGDFRAFAVLGCNFIQKCYPQKVYVHEIFQNWSFAKVFVSRMTKSFPNFLLICHIFWNFLNCLLYVRTLESRML